MACACNFNTWEAETRGYCGIEGQPRLQSKPPTLNKEVELPVTALGLCNPDFTVFSKYE